MLLKPQQRRIFLALGVTDMRKAINGLSILVEQHLEQNALSGDVFLFCNRSQTIVKAIYWDRCGFCLWQKRLEKSHFKWPKRREDLLEIEFEQLAWLLDGLDISQAFETLRYERVS